MKIHKKGKKEQNNPRAHPYRFHPKKTQTKSITLSDEFVNTFTQLLFLEK